MRIRERVVKAHLPTYLGTVYVRHWQTGAWIEDVVYTNPPSDAVVSHHYSQDFLNPGPPYRSGGPLILVHQDDAYRQQTGGSGSFPNGADPNAYGSYRKYVGTHVPGGNFPNLSEFTGYSTPSFGSLASIGATGWRRARPGNPSASLGQFIAEARDIPRTLRGSANYFSEVWKSMGGSRRAFAPKAVADAFLNEQFGWLPFVSDMRKFYKTYKTLNDRLARIRRYNGRWERRSAVVEDTTDTDTSVLTNQSYVLWPVLGWGGPWYTSSTPDTVQVTKYYKSHAWFVGNFRYYIPDISTPQWETRATRLLFGATINPSLLYEITPWSWLADYFVNAGDVISNIDNGWAENLVARSAYVMKTESCECELTVTRSFISGPVSATFRGTGVRKRRDIASPFGFGLTAGDLSNRQLAILSALGIKYS